MIFVDEKQLFYGFWMVLATTKVGDEEFQHTTSGAVELVEMWCKTAVKCPWKLESQYEVHLNGRKRDWWWKFYFPPDL